MVIIFTLISVLLSIALPLLILFFTGFSAIHFSLFFIIPVGALIIGYIGGVGFYHGLYKKNVFVNKKIFILGVVLSLVTIFGIKYGEYALTCIAQDGSGIEYSLSGDHVSNFIGPDEKPFNFISFTKLIVESTPISFSYKTRSIGSLSNPIVCWIFFVIDLLGVIGGCLFAGSMVSDKAYCHTCKKYMQIKDVFGVLASKGDEFFKDLDANLNKLHSQDSISYIKNFSVSLPLKKEAHYKGIIEYCEECRNATLKVELYTLNKKKALEKNNNFKYSTKIKYDTAMMLIKNETLEPVSV